MNRQEIKVIAGERILTGHLLVIKGGTAMLWRADGHNSGEFTATAFNNAEAGEDVVIGHIDFSETKTGESAYLKHLGFQHMNWRKESAREDNV